MASMNGSAVPITPCARQDHLAVFLDPRAALADLARFGSLGAGLFASRCWYEVVVDHGMAAGARPQFAVWSDRAGPALIVPLQRLADGQVQSLTTPYTCLYAPLLAPDLGPAAIQRAGLALGRFCRASAKVRLDSLDAGAAGLEPLLAGVRRAGLVIERFDHFGNWHEPVAGLSWQAYLGARPGALRETVRRKLARFERDPAGCVEVVTGAAGLDGGIAAFEDVYQRSWKEPEPFPAFNAAMMRAAAPLGLLRLGILRLGGKPIAVQFWIVQDGVATVLKLAHDEAFKPVSPGTVLTALMLRRLLDQERVAEIDFGRGDDPYKRQWTSQRRQRIGLLLINPLRPHGMAALGRQTLGRWRRAARSLVAPPRFVGRA